MLELELKENSSVNAVLVGGNDIPSVVPRIIQLQLRASGCDNPIVTPSEVTPQEKYDFKFDSDVCVVKEISEKCPAGFGSRKMARNPNAPVDREVLGLNKYQVCVSGGGSSTTGTKK